jgi:hypothetical protein
MRRARHVPATAPQSRLNNACLGAEHRERVAAEQALQQTKLDKDQAWASLQATQLKLAACRAQRCVSWAGRVCQLGGAVLSVGRGGFVSWAGQFCQLGRALLGGAAMHTHCVHGRYAGRGRGDHGMDHSTHRLFSPAEPRCSRAGWCAQGRAGGGAAADGGGAARQAPRARRGVPPPQPPQPSYPSYSERWIDWDWPVVCARSPPARHDHHTQSSGPTEIYLCDSAMPTRILMAS